ncbi:MAG: glutamate 5-kinase [Desulfovibrio sp.]|nr:MAG: glutamate 5-kinase [Desulfovibrio sp.]
MDWKSEQQELLAKAKRVVVKVGSAVLTDERGVAPEAVDKVAGEVSTLHERDLDVVLVSSGAVAAGRSVVCTQAGNGTADQCALLDMPDRQAASAIGQSRLMHDYDEAFSRRSKTTAQILLTRDDLESRRRFLNARNTFSTLLSWRVVPVVNENDTVMVEELEYGDNDSLAALLLNLVEADLFICLTSAPGVMDSDPLRNPGAKRIECLEDISSMDLEALCGGRDGGRTKVGTGGMYSKLLAAQRAAQLGVPTLILNGKEPEVIQRAMDGGNPGTWVRPEGKTISRRKFWLAYNRDPHGDIYIDPGAARALTERGKSLLPIGIVSVHGRFDRGDLVRIVVREKDQALGRELGVGLSNYRSDDLARIAGKKSDEIEQVLGYSYMVAVHRDNMLLDAVL